MPRDLYHYLSVLASLTHQQVIFFSNLTTIISHRRDLATDFFSHLKGSNGPKTVLFLSIGWWKFIPMWSWRLLEGVNDVMGGGLWFYQKGAAYDRVRICFGFHGVVNIWLLWLQWLDHDSIVERAYFTTCNTK